MIDQTAAVHAAITMTASPQTIATGITTPNTARALSVTGVKAGATLTGTVTINGTDEYGQTISAAFTLSGNYTVHATLPQEFATVTSIVVPAYVTNGDTVKVGWADTLADVPTIRACEQNRLTSTSDYSDAAILAKEAEVRQWLAKVAGVSFVPMLQREYLDGSGTRELFLSQPRVLAVTACVIYGSDMVATETFDATDLADLAIDESLGRIYRRTGGTFTRGNRNVLVTYVHGHRSVPDLIKRAACAVISTELTGSNIPLGAETYDDGGINVSFGRGDGYGGNWHRIPDVVKALRLHDESLPGVS